MSKHALRITRSRNRQQEPTDARSDGWTDEGTKPDRRNTRGAEKPCWCLPASDQVEWVVPSCSPSPYAARLRVYSCKIMPTTPDVPATTPFFDAASRLRLCGRRATDLIYKITILFNNARPSHFVFYENYIFRYLYNINYFACILGFYSDNTNKNIRIIELTLTLYKFYIALCYIVLFSRIQDDQSVK